MKCLVKRARSQLFTSNRTRILPRFKVTMRIISPDWIKGNDIADFVDERGGYDVIRLGIGNDVLVYRASANDNDMTVEMGWIRSYYPWTLGVMRSAYRLYRRMLLLCLTLKTSTRALFTCCYN